MVFQSTESTTHAVADVLIGIGTPVSVVALIAIGLFIRASHQRWSNVSIAAGVLLMILFGGVAFWESANGPVSLDFEPEEWHPRSASLSPLALQVGVRRGHRLIMTDTFEADGTPPRFRLQEDVGSEDTYRVVVDDEPVGVLEAEEIMEAGFHRQGHSHDGRTPLWTTLKLHAGAAPTWDCASGFHLRVAVDSIANQGNDYLAHLTVAVRRNGPWIERSRALANKRMSGFFFDEDEVFVGVREAGRGDDGVPWVAVTAFASPASTVAREGCGSGS